MLYATKFRHLARAATSATPVEGSGDKETQRLLEAEVLYGLDLGAVAIDAGIEAKREAIHSDRVRNAQRTLHSVEPFIQGTFARAHWSIVPGVRMSWSEQWGESWTPRLAALFRPADRLALRASLGRGYRAPDFKELYMEFLNVGPGFGYVVRGNPDLQPESSRNVSGSIEWAGDRVYLRAQAFHNRFRDFIESRELGDSSGVTVFTYGNIDDGITRGLELEVGTTWRGLRAEAGWGWLAAERAETGEELLGRPAQSGRASLSYALSFGLRASLTGVYTGETPLRREGDALIERPGFGRFDTRLAQSLPGDLEMTFGIDNIADVKPANWPGFLGRQLYLGLSWRTARDDATTEFDN
jgi:outer membrane receptor for ferrienterochelin and colicins